MRSNYRDVSLFPEFCHKNGISHLRFDFLRPERVPREDIFIVPDMQAIEYLRDMLPIIEVECRKNNIWFESTFEHMLGINVPSGIKTKAIVLINLPRR